MDIDYKALGLRIKFARLKKNLSQEILAEKADISVPHMSNIETGNTKASLPTLVSIANALETSVDTFLCDSVISSKHIFIKEVDEIFQDCDDFEVRFLVKMLKCSKDALRSDEYLRKFNN